MTEELDAAGAEECYLESNMETEKLILSESPIANGDDEELFPVIKKRIQTFSDSESDLDKENKIVAKTIHTQNDYEKNVDDDVSPRKSNNRRSRIKNIQNSDSENDSSGSDNLNIKLKHESIRTENRKRNLKHKFRNLLSSKTKEKEKSPISEHNNHVDDDSENDDHCLQIREILRSSVNTMKSICDPDTSDEDNENNREEKYFKQKHKSKKKKSTSPKSQRMSAKQAMENMQKIRSESNRMLREKEVSLPYHRPKALSLKDIMSKRKLAVTSDGKALPIKMNGEQLKQYAMMLEQRQKEVIDLCKSDTDDDEESPQSEKILDENISENPTNNSETLNKHIPEQQDLNDLNDKKETVTSNNDGTEIETNIPDTALISTNNEPMVEEKMEVEDNLILDKLNVNDKDVDISIVIEDHAIQGNLAINNDHTNGEDESQVIVLHYDSENVNSINAEEYHETEINDQPHVETEKTRDEDNNREEISFENDLNFDEIFADEELTDNTCDNKKGNEGSVINSIAQVNPTPKLTGDPGSLINLNDDDNSEPRKLSGVEKLKERFIFFANMKSENGDKDKEKKCKPGTQHLKLKHDLGEQIAEQRTIEWEKRLEEEKQLKSEINEHSTDDIEKMEAEMETEDKVVDESSESEEEPVEDDVILEDKPKKRNPMVDDEAEVSECDDEIGDKEIADDNEDANEENDAGLEDCDDESTDSSSESEEEGECKTKKGRILKAFEDSDDESGIENQVALSSNEEPNASSQIVTEAVNVNGSFTETQDDELQLAQVNKSSDDLFSTQESNALNKNNEHNTSSELCTQPFSNMNPIDKNQHSPDFDAPDKIPAVCATLSQDLNLERFDGISIRSLSQNFSSTQKPLSQSQEIGEDIALLCTGKFYDNPFVSQIDKVLVPPEDSSQKSLFNEHCESQEIGDDVAALCTGKFYDNPLLPLTSEDDNSNKIGEHSQIIKVNDDKETTVLRSILDELDGPDVEVKRNKYFVNTQSKDKTIENSQLKKKFVIDSDDENDNDTNKKVKKLKKRKAEQRALQFSDDENEDIEEDSDNYESDEEGENRIVEYDSEENEVEVQMKPIKKKRVGEFFENEAELTSEDEWVGSGDEDEKGLDQMEREEGDDDTFHQGQLQKELGQIHMREVLDQDKREVRLLQELLFEDGDLGDGHRQRKFRWRNADGELEMGTNTDELPDTQEDEFESEEQWRKQRHEREMFLRSLREKDQENVDKTINRSTIIKANLNSRSMSTLINESKQEKTEKPESVVPEKKSTKDIPSPKKPFTIFQQNYHGSLLTRGRGALARLAALATPLATDNDDAPKITASSNRRNFVFTALNTDDEPKVTTKRKADNVNTPRLIKKMKTEETSKYIKNSLFEHLKT